MYKKVVVLLLIVSTLIYGSVLAADRDIATKSELVPTVKEYTVKEVERAVEKAKKRDAAEHKRQQEDIKKRLDSLAERLISMRNYIIAAESTGVYSDDLSSMITEDGIIFNTNEYLIRYYIKDNEFQTVNVVFRTDFVSDFDTLENDMYNQIATFVRDAYKIYNSKGELR